MNKIIKILICHITSHHLFILILNKSWCMRVNIKLLLLLLFIIYIFWVCDIHKIFFVLKRYYINNHKMNKMTELLIQSCDLTSLHLFVSTINQSWHTSICKVSILLSSTYFKSLTWWERITNPFYLFGLLYTHFKYRSQKQLLNHFNVKIWLN